MSDFRGRKNLTAELDGIIDAMDDDVDTRYAGKLTIDESLEVIPFTLWESLAYDLALGTASHEQIADGYNVTLIQLQELVSNSHFTQLLTAKQLEVSKLGAGAAFTVAFRMIANKGIQSFMERVTSGTTPDKEFLGLFKQAVELAQLKPEENTEGGGNSPLAGPSITFNISGVPGLEHLASPQSNVIDAEPEQTIEYAEEVTIPTTVILERW